MGTNAIKVLALVVCALAAGWGALEFYGMRNYKETVEFGFTLVRHKFMLIMIYLP